VSAPAARPWWSYILPSRPPPLEAQHWNVLGLVLVAEIASQYAASLLVMSLPQIQASLAIPEESVGAIGGNVRIGMILTVFATALADRFGRRRMLLGFTAASCIATALTGFVQTGGQLVAVQTLLRVFLGAEFMLGAVVIAEEFAASARGFGLGALAMLGAAGYAAGIGLYAALESVDAGWRWLHFAGGLPLLALPSLARRLGETQRFAAQESSAMSLAASVAHPVRLLWASGRSRVVALGIVALTFEAISWPALLLVSKHLQDVHGYSPSGVSLVVLVGGLVGVAGNVAAGQLSDRFGRRPLVVAMLVGMAAGTWLLYQGTGASAPVGWAVASFAMTGGNVLLTALASELFPTAARSTAAGLRMSISSLGGALGFYAEAALYDGSHGSALVALLPVLAIAAVAVLFLPESAGRELEDL